MQAGGHRFDPGTLHQFGPTAQNGFRFVPSDWTTDIVKREYTRRKSPCFAPLGQQRGPQGSGVCCGTTNPASGPLPTPPPVRAAGRCQAICSLSKSRTLTNARSRTRTGPGKCMLLTPGEALLFPGQIKREKGVWWMPWQQEAMKDVIPCDKPWGAGNRLRSMDLRMGQPT